MPKLRISVVQYLNTFPLVWGFTHGPLAGKYDLSFTVPSQCAEQLRAREVDIAIIPAIEYQRIDDLVILPDLAIASKRRVRSLLLISKVPIAPAGAAEKSVKSIALDRSSRSTQALTKILCARHWQIAPQFRETPPDLPAMLAQNDAALLIGDPALRISLAIESACVSASSTQEFSGSSARRAAAPPCPSSPPASSSPLGSTDIPPGVLDSDPPLPPDSVGAGLAPPVRSTAQQPSASSTVAPEICDAATLGIPAAEKLYVYDIVEQWRAMTGLSAVLAVWAARPSAATPDVVADFHASRAFGLLHLHELCAAASAQLRLPAPALHSYLTDNIDFTLDPENAAALSKYFAESAALNLTPHAKPILLAPGPNRLVLESAVAKPR